ncbi:MAG: membrane protein insertion efficiency factor YidD [Patescibacteria group bacterium]
MLTEITLKIVRCYQKFLSPYLGNHCRFYPSCSAYCCLALRKHGVGKGLGLAIWRVMRCNPLNQGGVDIP